MFHNDSLVPGLGAVHHRVRQTAATLARFAAVACALFYLAALVALQSKAGEREFKLGDGSELAVAIHGDGRERLIVWVPMELGPQAGDARIADALAAEGTQVWRADMLDARLLPPAYSSIEKIPAIDVVELLRRAHESGAKKIYLLSSARGAALALRGAAQWRSQKPTADRLRGVLLLHPNLFVAPVLAGETPEYLPAVAQTALPIYVIQPKHSPWYWRLADLRAAFETAGVSVYTRTLSDVRDRFWFRQDATEAEQRAAAELPSALQSAMQALDVAPLARARAGAEKTVAPKPGAPAILVRELKPYRGDPRPPSLALSDLNGAMRSLADYRGKVVLVNFWASWCPPCVHEMPSMQRLKNRLAGRPFEILAVNMAEDEPTVVEFIKRLELDFTVLLDRDGAALTRWKVFVFPTTFLIGTEGDIRYALAGELAWDGEEAARVIEGLLAGR